MGLLQEWMSQISFSNEQRSRCSDSITAKRSTRRGLNSRLGRCLRGWMTVGGPINHLGMLPSSQISRVVWSQIWQVTLSNFVISFHEELYKQFTSICWQLHCYFTCIRHSSCRLSFSVTYSNSLSTIFPYITNKIVFALLLHSFQTSQDLRLDWFRV